MVRDMPKGVPGPNSHGLDQTRSWANTYWGGAVFCLLADVQYRERTQNRRGLQHALRGILAAGGNIQEEWPITRAFEVADHAAGVPVLGELYARMKDAAVPVDLPDLWRRLGVSADGASVRFNNDAELAAVRQAITAR
jgi:predicted metalloprotease with PDZ domain